ncbi:hypothetical protein AMS68_007174 [Peltaster fructicola]|uniref:Uncharacterized protein n=1 Tax=Peltaster fructicola TaxID=286661 RepID=A0A6H0Y3R2_9PEZI|nr:hypothetical protein AMS68_007174 [Peltaster fructicola]
MHLSLGTSTALPPMLARAAMLLNGRNDASKAQSNAQSRLILDGHTVVCDLRDTQQAAAFDKLIAEQSELPTSIETVTLRTWMLWPRRRSTSWEYRVVDIIISNGGKETNMIELQELPKSGVGEGQYHKDSYDRCQCSVHEMLKMAGINVQSIEADHSRRFTALETARLVAHMMQKHQKRAGTGWLHSSAKACGEHWNECDRCHCSQIFLCKDGRIIAAACGSTRSQVESASGGKMSKRDAAAASVVKRWNQIERGEPYKPRVESKFWWKEGEALPSGLKCEAWWNA